MLVTTFPILLIAITSALTSTASAATIFEWDRVENSTIYFKKTEGAITPKPIDTGLIELKILGTLANNDAPVPYFLGTGRPCENCLQDKIIFTIKADGTQKANHFVYPGRIIDPKTKQTVFEARAFYGQCLNGKNNVYVVFQRERVDRRNGLQQSVLVVEPGRDHIDERLIERRPPNINATLKMVKAKQCTEISGRNRMMLTKPLDLSPKRGESNDDDDDEEDKNDDAEKPQQEEVALRID